ncbi:MAG: radical SAM protein [Candidatus Omnitrophica bacterium]|nr:radical SAM protein [Candidatus Omnitrophota bacterium]
MNLKFFFRNINQQIFTSTFKFSCEGGKVNPPKYVLWDSTRRCNLNCEHCGAKDETYQSELSTKDLKKFIDDIARYRVEFFMATGGEPFLRNDLFEVFAHAKERKLHTGVATNGFFINEQNVSDVDRFFESIMISIDGTREVHNKIRRNPQAFDKAMQALSLLKKKSRAYLTASTTITKSNVGDLQLLAKKIAELKPDQWRITSIMPIGNAAVDKALALDQKDFIFVLDFIKKNRKQFNIQVGENLGYLGRYEREIKDGPFFCPVGYLTCCLGVEGNIRGCPEQPDNDFFHEGNILKDTFENIWSKGFRKYREQDLIKNETCNVCKDKKMCAGGCWVMKLNSLNCSKMIYKL